MNRWTRFSLFSAGCLAGIASAQQASINLQGCDSQICHHTETDWSLSKVASYDSATATADWCITASKGATTDPEIMAAGFVRVKNAGTAGATIGSIVVNLQRRAGNTWVTASSNVANGSTGDAATTALICSGASSEGLGSFTENGASGAIEFTDASSNTLWAISPQVTIPAGGSVPLIYQAHFDNSVLNIPAGEEIRIEFIVTFGNAGPRGSGGASCTNLDINGSGGALDPDENNVRSVPCRTTRTVPALETCGGSAVLTDGGPTTTGTVTFATFDDGGIGSGMKFTDSDKVVVSAFGVLGGTDGGEICNAANLHAAGSSITVTDTVTGTTYTVPCCREINLNASDCVEIEEEFPGEGFPNCSFSSYTQGGYQGGGVPGQILANNFASAFPNGLTIGVNDGGGSLHHATWTAANAAALAVCQANWAACRAACPSSGPGAAACRNSCDAARNACVASNDGGLAELQSYLAGGGPSGALTADTTDASSTSGGTLAKQTATLTLNIGFNNANVASCSTSGCSGPGNNHYADLRLCIPGGNELNGFTIAQILDIANNALGGLGLPSTYTYSSLNDLVTHLNEAFDNCIPSDWARANLCQ